MKVFITVCGVIVALGLLLWLGRLIKPRPFPAYAERTPAMATIPLPGGLPAPVDRYYRKLYGEQIPVIKSAVLTGQAMMRPAGPFYFPARWRFTYVAGQAYRHYIEVTLFGIPINKADEQFIDGKGKMDITLIGHDEGENVDLSGNLGLWAESSYFPSVYLTDPRVHWEPIDDHTALLVVPFRDTTDRFVVRFDPKTDLITWLESMRYHSSTSTDKVLWLNHRVETGDKGGPTTSRGQVIWMDDGKPWFEMEVGDAVYNVDVAEYIRGRGL